VADPALRNALYKKDESVFDDPNEMGFIAETLVCSVIERWISSIRDDDRVGYFSDRGEVDFIFKYGAGALPIEVKWRNDVPALKTLDSVVKKWKLKESLVVTKDFDVTYVTGRLSAPLWFFLLIF
jgi:predicted AAA+ superfamily ATPase